MAEPPLDISEALRVRRRPVARRASRAKREAAILEATIELVGEVGIADAHISDIAERAGMSPGHVLYYFPTKDSLLLAALVLLERDVSASGASQTEQRGSPLETLRLFLAHSAPRGLGDARYMLWLSIWERAARDEQVREIVEHVLSSWVGTIETLLIEAREAGEIKCDDVALEARRISALHDGLGIAVVSAARFITRRRMLDVLDDEIERLRRSSA